MIVFFIQCVFCLQSYKKAVSFQDIVFVFVATRYGCLFNLSGRIKKTSAYFGENMLMFFYFLYKIQKLLYDLF
ncbi:MAG TPA: hypothetical protein DHW75_02075 [Bacteroides sp.]|nr:hypothetical protein [Bacteroides sp.]